jgi:hypothetical protein
MNNSNKDIWIDKVLSSTQGMERAQPQSELYEQVLARLSRPQPVVRPLHPIRWAAAAILLLAVNIASVIYFSGNASKTTVTAESPLAAEIQLQTTYNY